MKYLIKNAAIEIQGNTILNEINMEILDSSHIGIVGRNGAGKTTLLHALVHQELFIEGVDDIPLKIETIGCPSIGYLEQITFPDESKTLEEEMKNSYPKILTLERKLDTLIQKMESQNDAKTIEEYTTALKNFEYLGGYTYKKEYETMLSKFGFTEEEKRKPIKNFSGGERTKIAFLKLLLAKNDILLLDEPTNHLDIEAIEWLENYLKNYKKAFVIVSHDRMFLNNTVNTIYDISYGKTQKYIGNYENYEKQKQEIYEKTRKNYERQQKEIARLYALYEKFRSKPTKAKMALSKLHMIERMEKIEQPKKASEKAFRMNLNAMEKSGKNVLSCKNIEIGYDITLSKLNFEILQGEKVGVIGANGTGKSTLLKTISGILPPRKGHISFGYHVNIGYFDQNLKMLNEEHTVLEEFKKNYPNCLEKEARNTLGAFLFSGLDVEKKINVLSGGEKVRLSLCKILYKKPNFLLLDEPTNHLDLIGKIELEKILSLYKGTILFVSHDRYFTSKLATRLLIFKGNDVLNFPYTYKEYIEKQANIEIKEEKPKVEKQRKEKLPDKGEKNELSNIEKRIEKLTIEKETVSKELYKEENFTDYQKMNVLQKKWEQITNELSLLEKEWMECSEKMEA